MALVRGKGFESPMAVYRETTFATQPTVSTQLTDRIPYLSESLLEKIALVESDALLASAGRMNTRGGNKTVEGSFETDLVYTKAGAAEFCGVDLLICLAMGGTPLFNASWNAAGGDMNILPLIDDNTQSCTIVIDKEVEEHTFAGCMIKGFTISGEAGGIVKCNFDVIGKSLTLGTTWVPGGTDTDNADRVLFSDGVYRISDRADILAATDNIGISDFTFSFDNNFDGALFSSLDADEDTHGDSRLTRKPIRNGFREATLEFTLVRYATGEGQDIGTLAEDWKAATTPLQFTATFTRGTGASIQQIELMIPNLLIEDLSEPVEGAGAIQQKVKCKLYRGIETATYNMLKFMANTVATSTAASHTSGTVTVDEEFAMQFANGSGIGTDGRTSAIWA